MELNFDFSLVQSQKLLLTPQLKQALEVLGMTSQELFDHVEKQLEINPVIDVNSAYPEESAQEESDDDWEESRDGEEAETGEGAFRSYDGTDDPEGKLSLKDYLLLQLHSANLQKDQLRTGEYLIDNVDENGYLSISLTEAAEYFGVPVRRVLEVLELIQSFDPPGICSRSLRESLCIQLRQMKCDDTDVFTIVENYLDDLAAGRFSRITRQTGLKRGKLREILQVIRSLEPKPGREFYRNGGFKVQMPDVILKEIDGLYRPIINEEAFPVVNINSFYRQMAENERGSEAEKFLQSRMNNALWLIKCIEQRKSILMQITQHIIQENTEFFSKAVNRPKLVSFLKAAEKLEMHETILRKAISGKFIQCSWGILEIAEFFI